jgi:hypothetical protein
MCVCMYVAAGGRVEGQAGGGACGDDGHATVITVAVARTVPCTVHRAVGCVCRAEAAGISKPALVCLCVCYPRCTTQTFRSILGAHKEQPAARVLHLCRDGDRCGRQSVCGGGVGGVDVKGAPLVPASMPLVGGAARLLQIVFTAQSLSVYVCV